MFTEVGRELTECIVRDDTRSYGCNKPLIRYNVLLQHTEHSLETHLHNNHKIEKISKSIIMETRNKHMHKMVLCNLSKMARLQCGNIRGREVYIGHHWLGYCEIHYLWKFNIEGIWYQTNFSEWTFVTLTLLCNCKVPNTKNNAWIENT